MASRSATILAPLPWSLALAPPTDACPFLPQRPTVCFASSDDRAVRSANAPGSAVAADMAEILSISYSEV